MLVRWIIKYVVFSLIPIVLSVCVTSIVRRKRYLNVLVLCTKITFVKIKQLWSCLVTFILLTFSYITPKLTKYVIQAHFWLDDGSRGSSWTVGRSVQIILGAGPGGGAAGLILNKGDLTSNKPLSLTSPSRWNKTIWKIGKLILLDILPKTEHREKFLFRFCWLEFWEMISR